MTYGNIASVAAGLDFGALPPEVNSGRMYVGPGSAPLLTAAGAWGALSAELSITAIGYTSVIAELTGVSWLGPTSVAMAAAATPFATWLNQTAGIAAEIAGRAQAAAAAYDLAFSMTVPPAVIAANRSLLLTLIATNFFGQNAAAIAATEAHYAQMWTQDATAMYLYAESSAQASALPSFREPPQTTHAAGLVAHSGATDATLAQQLETALSSPAVQTLEHVPNVTNSVLSSANAVTSGRGIYVINMRLAAQQALAPDMPLVSEIQLATTYPTRAAPRRISATMGRATLVGRLSAPQSWVAAAPEIRPAAMVLPGPATDLGPATSADTAGSIFSQSVLGTLSRDGPKPAPAKSKPIIVRCPAAG